MGATFEKALERNVLPRKVGDVSLVYETTLLVGRADKPPRGLYATLSLIAGLTFGLCALWAFIARESDAMLQALVAPSILAFAAAAWLEQRDRRQRAFVVNFADHVLRLDFSTPLTGMPRTFHLPFDDVRDVGLSGVGNGKLVLTVDFELNAGLFREVLIANVTAAQRDDAERMRRMIRAAVGLTKPPDEPKPYEPPPVTDSFV